MFLRHLNPVVTICRVSARSVCDRLSSRQHSHQQMSRQAQLCQRMRATSEIRGHCLRRNLTQCGHTARSVETAHAIVPLASPWLPDTASAHSTKRDDGAGGRRDCRVEERWDGPTSRESLPPPLCRVQCPHCVRRKSAWQRFLCCEE